MNLASVLTSVFRRGVKPLYATKTGLMAQQTRENTHVFQRKYPIKLYKKGGKPHRLRPRNFIYERVENANEDRKKPIDLILMDYVLGVGNRGDRISVGPMQAYNKYILPKLAVYASPENLELYKEDIANAKEAAPLYSSQWALRTVNVLSKHLATVIVSQDYPWTLEKYHIRAALRKKNIHVPDEAITMPDRPIQGPDLDKENKEFYVTITVNNKEQVKLRCRLHHYTSKPYETIVCKDFWAQQEPAIFPEDQPVLDAMPKHELWKDKDASTSA